MTGDRSDPFATAAWRATVLRGWEESPSRFREDANAEEDYARGAYRDRLVTELAQNAADAAAAAEVEGRLLLRLDGDTLVAANTGQGLDLGGVQGLSTLRASVKRTDTGAVGRYGVGFAAVLAVSDEPSVLSPGRGVTFSMTKTREEVLARPRLRDELHRRDLHVPVLRLPFLASPGLAVPAGYDTAVVLPLRDDAARSTAAAALAAVDDALLLALPALAEVTVEGPDGSRVLRVARVGLGRGRARVTVYDADHVRRWTTFSSTGSLDPQLLADRPVEERQRRGWSVTWALPLDSDDLPRRLEPPSAGGPPSVAPVLHAPTPTDEPVSLPALLIASLPLEPGRRRPVPGRLTTWLLEQACERYADLVEEFAHTIGPRALELVPRALPAGRVDAVLLEGTPAVLRGRGWIPQADDGGLRLVPTEAARLEPTLRSALPILAQTMSGLAAAGWSGPAMELLGSPLLRLVDVLDDLAGVQRAASWWVQLYDALDRDGVDAATLEGLPIPLVRGRMARGPRGVVLVDDDETAETLADLPQLQVAQPRASHPLLLRLGAVAGEPDTLLASEAVRGVANLSLELEDPEPTSRAVLHLVARAGAPSVAGYQRLAVRTQSGDWAAAGDLVLPGSALAEVLDPPLDELASLDWVTLHGPEVLAAVGVADGFQVTTLVDQPLDPDLWEELVSEGAEWVAWVEDLLGEQDAPPFVPEAVVLPRLAHVPDDRWPRVVDLITSGPARDAVVRPTRVLPMTGSPVDVASPAAWWLRDAPLFDGRAPRDLRTADSDPLLHGLFEPVPATVSADDQWLAAVGVRRELASVLADPDGPDDLLARLADPQRPVSTAQLVALYRALATLPESQWPDPPELVRIVSRSDVPDETRVVAAAGVTVALSPLHVPLVDGEHLAGSPALAALLDLPSTQPWLTVFAPSAGIRQPLSEALSPWVGPAASWTSHDDLHIEGVPVDGWVDPDGGLHAATVDGLARAVAWGCGRWADRHEIALVLADPSLGGQLRADRAFD